MNLKDERIGFLGGGAMAEALLGGLLAAGVPREQLCASDPEAGRRSHLESSLGIAALAENAEVVRRSSVVVLAVKPGTVAELLEALQRESDLDRLRPLWISIAAGVTLATLASGLGAAARIVRAMPNTPALVGHGATGFCANPRAAPQDRELARALFESVGVSWEAPAESLLDAVTGLSGSGPAFVFRFLEALVDAGEAAGLPREAAAQLAQQTLYGAARLARDSDRSPAELRQQVSSPGGTTLAGLARLEERGFADAVRDAVAAATRRAGELGRGE